MHRHAVEYSTYPRGPRSGPGCSVPVRHHLIGPIRPTRRHIAISPHGGLYAMPSLCGSSAPRSMAVVWYLFSCHILQWLLPSVLLPLRPFRKLNLNRKLP
jgi:hypothetical protein